MLFMHICAYSCYFMLNQIETKHHSGPNCFSLPSGQEVTQAHPTSKNHHDPNTPRISSNTGDDSQTRQTPPVILQILHNLTFFSFELELDSRLGSTTRATALSALCFAALGDGGYHCLCFRFGFCCRLCLLWAVSHLSLLHSSEHSPHWHIQMQ